MNKRDFASDPTALPVSKADWRITACNAIFGAFTPEQLADFVEEGFWGFWQKVRHSHGPIAFTQADWQIVYQMVKVRMKASIREEDAEARKRPTMIVVPGSSSVH